MGAKLDFRYDAGLLVVAYTEEGAAWEEALYTAIQDMSPLGEKTGRVVSVILNSVELNPKWVEGEIRGQMQRSQIALRTQQEVQRLDREMVEHRQRTNAEIDSQMFHNLMRTEVGSSEWNYRWVNESGETVYSDDPNYDPSKNGLTGFQRSQPRKRFPDQ